MALKLQVSAWSVSCATESARGSPAASLAFLRAQPHGDDAMSSMLCTEIFTAHPENEQIFSQNERLWRWIPEHIFQHALQGFQILIGRHRDEDFGCRLLKARLTIGVQAKGYTLTVQS